MKAQGLSVSFVVVAALAILILVLAVAFVMGWFHSGAGTVTMQQAKQRCTTYCNEISTALANVDCTTGRNLTQQQSCVSGNASSAYNNYCNTHFKISGTSYTCPDIVPCNAVDATGNSIPVSCS